MWRGVIVDILEHQDIFYVLHIFQCILSIGIMEKSTETEKTNMEETGKKTLLLCFIHGFKGDEETFFQFPDDLKKQIQEQSPGLKIETRVYPKYETRGDLAACVEIFKEWLQEQVIGIEKENGTVGPVQNPSVGVVLVAHSMGGFVAADTLFSILDNRPVSSDKESKLMFPLTYGLISFDTPFNGLSRSLFAYGAINQYQNISSAWNLISTLSSPFAAVSSVGALASANASQVATTASSTAVAARQATSWKRWQAMAARTGAIGAICAGGVLAWQNREQLQQSFSSIQLPKRSEISLDPRKIPFKAGYTQGMSYVTKENVSQGLTYVSKESIGEGFAWLAGHLKFVGALMKGVQMETRLARLSGLEGVGVNNLYTSLGENGVWTGGYFIPKRTFCAIPVDKKEASEDMWIEAPNLKAKDEVEAHCSMFQPGKNPGYKFLLEQSTKLILSYKNHDPKRVKDDYRPNREQLERRHSESQTWDDDGKVLKPPADDVDERQLEAILESSDMPEREDGGVDEETLKKALEVPLPIDEDIDGAEGRLGSLTVDDQDAHGGLGAVKGLDEKEEKKLSPEEVPLPAEEQVKEGEKTTEKAEPEKKSLLQKGLGLFGRS